MKDVLGRSWQMGTIQLDAQMPARFGLAFAGEDNREHTPYVIHRALLGSLERFMGILIEHFGGDFPLWLAPEQVRVLAISERFAADAESLADDLRVHGFRASVDEREETLGRKIRDAELAKIPYVVVWGERESLDALALRRRGGEQTTVGWEALLSELQAAARL
jgi:threonyl-tRNA synthetase